MYLILGVNVTIEAEDNVDITKSMGNDAVTKTRVREKIIRVGTVNKGNCWILQQTAILERY